MNEPRYNHLCAIAFGVESASPTFDGITPTELVAALYQRINDLRTDLTMSPKANLTEYIEDLEDTYEIEEPEAPT
jgi:hypothetical protein